MKLNFVHENEYLRDAVIIDEKPLDKFLQSLSEDKFNKVSHFLNFIVKDSTAPFTPETIVNNISKLIDVDDKIHYAYVSGWKITGSCSNIKEALEQSMGGYLVFGGTSRLSRYIEHLYQMNLIEGKSEEIASLISIFSVGGVDQCISLFNETHNKKTFWSRVKKFLKM
jgi:hypothetical protein